MSLRWHLRGEETFSGHDCTPTEDFIGVSGYDAQGEHAVSHDIPAGQENMRGKMDKLITLVNTTLTLEHV